MSIEKGYEFDMVSFSCEQDENEGLETWQIEAVIESKDEVKSSSAFRERWRSEHPDRNLRMLQMIDFGAEPDLAFVVLYSVKD